MVASIQSVDIDVYLDVLPELDPIIRHHHTEDGWRALTQGGEILNIHGTNIRVPEDEIIVAIGGKPIGRRRLFNDESIDIDRYLHHYDAVVALYRNNQIGDALTEADAAVAIAPTLRAKFNRSMILLAAGCWKEGFAGYFECEQHKPFIRPQAQARRAIGVPAWEGRDCDSLVLLHAHGFGDTIQMLRYVPVLRQGGINVRLNVPIELQSIAEQFAPLETGVAPDCYCPFLHLLHHLHVTPDSVDSSPYIKVGLDLIQKWKLKLGPKQRKRIGIAWSIGKLSDGDYPREIPLNRLIANLSDPDVELISVQTQGRDEAFKRGVRTFDFTDFEDCAALMLQMDEIISVDTAALHLAGAIGHPRVFGLLSHWASWRWLAPWYENVTLCRQDEPGNWASALAQIHAG